MAAMLALKLSPHGLSRFVAPCHRQFFYVQLTDWRGSHSVNRTWLVTAFFFALLLLILYCAFLILTPFLTAITWAAILAILFYPVYAGLLELMRGRATLAAMTVIVVITIIVIAPGVELARFLADEAVSLLQSVRLLLDEDGKQQWLAQPWVQHLIGWWDMATFRLVDFKIDWKNLLIQGAQSSSTFIVTQVKGIAQNVLLFTVNFIVALFMMVPSWSVGSSGWCRWTESINSGCSKTSSTPFWPWCTVPWSSRWSRGCSPAWLIGF
jgi:hypothetical protein